MLSASAYRRNRFFFLNFALKTFSLYKKDTELIFIVAVNHSDGIKYSFRVSLFQKMKLG